MNQNKFWGDHSEQNKAWLYYCSANKQEKVKREYDYTTNIEMGQVIYFMLYKYCRVSLQRPAPPFNQYQMRINVMP